jgi:hypothetical protein
MKVSQARRPKSERVPQLILRRVTSEGDKETKEYIANKLFKSLEELEALIHQLFNEGGLTIYWGRKIKNKGSSIVAS